MPARMLRTVLLLVPLLAIAASGVAAQESARERWQRVPEIFTALGIGPGSHVADVGAGDGFFSVRLADAVGDSGRVYAVDVSTRALERLRDNLEREGIDNVEVIEGAIDDPRLPEATLDAALIVNAYHEMTEYPAMLARLRRALKPEGRLVLVEPITPDRREATRQDQVDDHEIAPWFVEAELREAGFHVLQLVDPFTTRGRGRAQETLLVATPGVPVEPASTVATAPEPPVVADEADDLRIAVADYDELARAGAVQMIDVRGDRAFERGHLPGARSVPLEDLEERVAELAADGRTVVAYCD